MLTKTTTENLEYKKESILIEILNVTNPPVIKFHRRQSIFKDGNKINEEIKTHELIFNPDLTIDIGGKTISALDVYLFIRTVGDSIDPLI